MTHNKKGTGKIMHETAYKIRKEFQENDDIRDAGLTTPKNVERFDDICYGADSKWQILDVYIPKDKQQEKSPVIISFHGGGWAYGDKERYQFYCMSLVKYGFAVVNYTYRLAPEFQYPAPLEDTNLVVKWVLEHEKEYGFDIKHIFMVGDSAGAQGLALYAAICTNEEYAKEYKFKVPDGFVPKAIALNCGIASMSMKEGELTSELMLSYLPEKGTDKEMELMSPVLQMTEQYPPTFVMTAEGDFLRDEAPKLVERLTECDVPVCYRFYRWEQRPLGHVFHCDMRLKMAEQCNADECAFFKEFI